MTRVAYLKRNVAGAMEDVAEDWSQSSPHLSSVEPRHQMLELRKRKNQTLLERKKREMPIKCIHIFSENNQSTCMWRQALTIYSDGPAGRRWMDGEMIEEEQSSQSAMSRREDRV